MSSLGLTTVYEMDTLLVILVYVISNDKPSLLLVAKIVVWWLP